MFLSGKSYLKSLPLILKMKKEGLMVIILVLLFLPFVLGLSMSLNSPSSGNTTNMTSIIFSCTATETGTISSIALYMNTSSSPWTAVSTQSNSSTSANFLVSSLSQGTYIWNCLATNSNSETASASSNYSLTISTLAFSGIIANYSITEDTNSSALFDLDSYFTGASSYTFSGNSSILLSIDSSNQITIEPSANFTGSQNITITGVYGSSTKTSNEILINVTNTNDAPLMTNSLSDITLEKNTVTTLDMDDYFTDIDPSTTWNYSLSASHISLSQDGETITLTPETDWEGSESATITASDGSAEITSNSFAITVGSTSNTAPSIDSYSPDSDPNLEVGDTQDFTITTSDAEEESLTITWTLDDATQSDTDESYSFTASEEGVFTLEATVSDGIDKTSQSWTITVGEELISDTEVDSILAKQGSESSVCGNKIVEEGENCSSCALDVSCGSGSICTQGVCEQKKSATKAIMIFALVSIGILFFAILIYYFTTLKKGAPPQKGNTFQYTPVGTSPPVDYTDFYKGKK